MGKFENGLRNNFWVYPRGTLGCMKECRTVQLYFDNFFDNLWTVLYSWVHPKVETYSERDFENSILALGSWFETPSPKKYGYTSVTKYTKKYTLEDEENPTPKMTL